MALGASRSDILKLVMKEGMSMVVVGLVIGVALAAGAGQLLKSLLLRVGAADPIAFAGVGAVLIGVALLATYLPARRATTEDPASVLRSS